MNPRVNEVIPRDDYKLMLIFTNAEKGIYDCSDLLNFGAFQEFQDKNYLNKVKILDGTMVWSNEQDICPDTLYLDSINQSA